MALPQIYKLPTYKPPTYQGMGSSYMVDIGAGMTREQTEAQKQQLAAQGWRIDETSLRAYNPEYERFKTDWSKLGNYLGGVDPESVWMRGTGELETNLSAYQREAERAQRRYQEALNAYTQGGGTPQQLAELNKWAGEYNKWAQGLAGFMGASPEYAQAGGYQDVSQMVGGTPGAGTTTTATGQIVPTETPQNFTQTQEQVEAWRASQGLPTTAQMQAPGYQAPSTTPTAPGPTQLSPTWTPGQPTGPTAPTGGTPLELGPQIRDPKELALYREEDIIRMPDNRIYLRPEVQPRTFAAGAPTPGAMTPTTGLGTRVPSPDYLKYYTESEITRDANGNIYLKPGVPVRWGKETGLPEGLTTATEDLTRFEAGLQGINLAEGTPYGELMGDYANALASVNKPITEIQNKIIETLMSRPSTVDTLNQLKETYGIKALNDELLRLSKASQPLEEALEKLPEDIKERYKDVGISAAHERRRLAVESVPLTESINKITKAKQLTQEQLEYNTDQANEVFKAVMADQEREDSILNQQMKFYQDNVDMQKDILDTQFKVALSAIEEKIKAEQPDITVKEFTNEYGDVTMVGIDERTGEKVWQQELDKVAATQKWTTEDTRFSNVGAVDLDTTGIPQELLSNCVQFARYFVPDFPMVGVSETSHEVNATGKRNAINSQTPVAGAVAIMPEVGFYGHVGIIKSVNGDGTVNLIETNYNTGQLTNRTGTPAELGIEGYFVGKNVDSLNLGKEIAFTNAQRLKLEQAKLSNAPRTDQLDYLYGTDEEKLDVINKYAGTEKEQGTAEEVETYIKELIDMETPDDKAIQAIMKRYGLSNEIAVRIYNRYKV